MTNQLIKIVEEKYTRKDLPEIKPGMLVRVWQKYQEKKKERLQSFEGLVISVKRKKGTRVMFTVRGEAGGQMIEKTYPLHSPVIEKIEILGQAKTRRAKLYFVRKLHPREIKKKLKITL
ncbi:MAG: 50S ribosomal protein L19 [Patescibacteria group bacterium]